MTPATKGPLAGLKVIEMAALGPVPFCGMMLADMGAEVLRIDRAADAGSPVGPNPAYAFLSRGRRSLALDLKSDAAVALVLELVEKADILLEGFRPGVMERLGLGPDVCATRNPGLIYGRMTGWGQTGPLAQAAGHDLNYIALTGVLQAIGPKDGPPVPPLNLLGDFGAGSMYLLSGVLAALHERRNSGLGQVIDAAILDGTISLATALYGAYGRGDWSLERQSNTLDGGLANYRCYQTRDGAWVSVAPLESRFLAQLCEALGLPATVMKDPEALERALMEVFATQNRDHWVALLEGTDACFAPVLSLAEAPQHPQIAARGLFQQGRGVTMPAPPPMFSRTPMQAGEIPARVGASGPAALQTWGISAPRIRSLCEGGVIARPSDEGVAT